MEEKIFESTYGGVLSDPHKFGWVTSSWNQLYDKESETVSFSVEIEVAELLYSIIRAVKPLVVVETGHHVGLSTAWIAYGLKQNYLQYEKIIESHRKEGLKGVSKEKIDMLSKNLDFFRGHLYTVDSDAEKSRLARYALRDVDLREFVTFFTGDSITKSTKIMETIKRAGQDEIDLLFLDASHEKEDVLREVEAFLPYVKEGGYIAFHDTTLYPGEDAAVKEFLKQNGPQVEYIRFATARGFDLVRVENKKI